MKKFIIAIVLLTSVCLYGLTLQGDQALETCTGKGYSLNECSVLVE